MPRIEQSMASKVLGVREGNPSVVRASDDYVQALALMLGYDDSNRIPIRCSPTGVLSVAGPRLADVVHFTATGANQQKQGHDTVCTEILCVAHPDNGGRIWVRTRKDATANNALPLEAGDMAGFTVSNFADMHALIVVNGDKLIVGYSL